MLGVGRHVFPYQQIETVLCHMRLRLIMGFAQTILSSSVRIVPRAQLEYVCDFQKSCFPEAKKIELARLNNIEAKKRIPERSTDELNSYWQEFVFDQYFPATNHNCLLNQPTIRTSQYPYGQEHFCLPASHTD